MAESRDAGRDACATAERGGLGVASASVPAVLSPGRTVGGIEMVQSETWTYAAAQTPA